ncbi:fumarate hydratase [Candidatus Omnitrophus magneticus]|uniref:Fumarate hydratase n=1 Tax=Candidatus Omnitrophus magneticus TaxID=1609969 RepID=A0A0F0CUA1_9BACT|nr:fumarate hydratase [Candidatus Omnitrophus magneticus]
MSIRFISANVIKDKVKELCLKANTELRSDVLKALKALHEEEDAQSTSKDMIRVLLKNAEIAFKEKLAICQDTGMATIFIELGNNIMIRGENLFSIVENAVGEAYTEYGFRASIVDDALARKNTGNNTPSVIHLKIVDGNNIRIDILPKGFGSENKSRIVMLNPTASKEEIIDFCVSVVKQAGPDACPPYALGIGIGGTFEGAPLLAKHALLRDVTISSNQPHVAELEKEIKKRANDLKIGIMGLGGKSTVMAVNIETGPTHIAGLPVAVNISCHALRSAGGVI